MSMDCPRSDAVVAMFLDADHHDAAVGSQVAVELADHLESCPRCAQVLAKQRRIDAVLASRTSTEIEEGVADRLLGFLKESSGGGRVVEFSETDPQTSRSQSVGVSHDRRNRLLRVAASLVAASLVGGAFYLSLGSDSDHTTGNAPFIGRANGEGREHALDAGATHPVDGTTPQGSAVVDPARLVASRNSGAVEHAETAGVRALASIELPNDFRRRERRVEPRRADWLRAFAGEYVVGLSSSAVLARARQVFDQATSLAPKTAAVVDLAPRSRDTEVVDVRGVRAAFDFEFRTAALRWYVRNRAVFQPHDRRQNRDPQWVDFVLATRDAERAVVVADLRPLVRDRVERLPMHRRTELAGALGVRCSPKTLRELDVRSLLTYASAACLTADSRCLDAALDAALAMARHADRAEHLAMEFVARLPSHVRSRLAGRAALRLASLRRNADRRALQDLFFADEFDNVRTD
ncbi:MAG: hypothetical protein KDC95_13730 [Planctomycetes bacterium]|nr:hypothetical protein [Planctomycetota bacterium]